MSKEGAAGRWLRSRGSGDPPLMPLGVGPTRAIRGLTALLAFLGVLALGLASASDQLATTWQPGGLQTATLQIIAPSIEVEAQARAALDVLRSTDGIASVRIIGLEEQMALLEPWLGAQIAADGLPLPLLIEVSIDAATLDQAALMQRLNVQAPGAVLDDNIAWRSRLAASARGLSVFAMVCFAGIVVAQALVTILAMRGTVAENLSDARTLRLIGARDSIISNGCRRLLAHPTLAAILVGSAAAAALLGLLPSDPAGVFLLGITPANWTDWMMLLIAPAAIWLVFQIAARFAARRYLRRWT